MVGARENVCAHYEVPANDRLRGDRATVCVRSVLLRGLSSRELARAAQEVLLAIAIAHFYPLFVITCLTLSLPPLSSIAIASAVSLPLQRALSQLFWCSFGAVLVRFATGASWY